MSEKHNKPQLLLKEKSRERMQKEGQTERPGAVKTAPTKHSTPAVRGRHTEKE